MYSELYTVRAFWRIFISFWKFLNSSRLINYQLIGLWLYVNGSQMGGQIMNLMNSGIVYRKQLLEIRNLQFICVNGARISDSCESRTVYSWHNNAVVL